MRFSLWIETIAVLAITMLLGACAATSAVEYQVVSDPPVSSPTHIITVNQTATLEPSPTMTVTAAPTTPATPSPFPYDDPDYFYGSLTVTLDHVGQTIQLKKNQNFLLRLGKDYDWAVTIGPETVISRNMRLTPEPGEQGVYVARGTGKATLRAIGEPKCRFSRPACGRPAVLFEAAIEIK